MFDFKNLPYNDSGVVYRTDIESVKRLYDTNPDQAFELAFSFLEIACCGECSSDDNIINAICESAKYRARQTIERYSQKVEDSKDKKRISQKLDDIARLYQSGMTQTAIAKSLGTTQQTINNRLKVIREKYPELLEVKVEQKERVKEEKFVF